MTNPMFASIRTYNGTPTLVAELVKHADAIKTVLQPIRGFHAYYLVETPSGAVSVTLCDDRAGADQSNQVAAAWLKDKLPTLGTLTPEITTGDVRMMLESEMVKVAR